MIEHGKYQGNSETNEKYSGYDEDYECHVYDFLCKVKKCKAEARNTEPYFYALQSAISRLLRHIPDAKSRYFDQHEEIPDDKNAGDTL